MPNSVTICSFLFITNNGIVVIILIATWASMAALSIKLTVVICAIFTSSS